MEREPLDERSWMTPPDPTHDAHSAWDTPDPPPTTPFPTQHQGLTYGPPPPTAPSYAPPLFGQQAPGSPPAWIPPPSAPSYAAPLYGQQAPGSPPAWVPPPNNHLVWAILVTIFCFLPFGVVAIVKASSVNLLWSQGRWAEAQRASAAARTWSIWAMLALPLMFVVVIGLSVASRVS